jgi:hypothetical protein
MIVYHVSTDPDPHPAAEFVDRYIMKYNDRVRVQFPIPSLCQLADHHNKINDRVPCEYRS